MTNEHSTESEDRLQTVSDAFAEWRQQTRGKRSPIPEELWQAAAALSAFYSTSKISKALRLDYAKLKLYVTKASPGECSFIELKAESLFPAPQCSIRLQSPSGFHMEIRASSCSQLQPLIAAFLAGTR
jgi:hypothetical protein